MCRLFIECWNGAKEQRKKVEYSVHDNFLFALIAFDQFLLQFARLTCMIIDPTNNIWTERITFVRFTSKNEMEFEKRFCYFYSISNVNQPDDNEIQVNFWADDLNVNNWVGEICRSCYANALNTNAMRKRSDQDFCSSDSCDPECVCFIVHEKSCSRNLLRTTIDLKPFICFFVLIAFRNEHSLIFDLWKSIILDSRYSNVQQIQEY